jgi:hypothetical protein
MEQQHRPPAKKTREVTTFDFVERGAWESNDHLIDATANVLGGASKASGTDQAKAKQAPAP